MSKYLTGDEIFNEVIRQTKICVLSDCGNAFIPQKSSKQKFCSCRCQQRDKDRKRRETQRVAVEVCKQLGIQLKDKET